MWDKPSKPHRYLTPLAAAPHFKPVDPTPAKRKFQLPDSYLLYFGSNKPHKNLTALILAHAKLKDAPPLIIAGAWLPEHPEPKMMVEQHGLQDRVRFLGRIDSADVPALFSGATLFVFPSLYEGFGLPVIEAMACGVPVACGNVWSLPEVGGEVAAYFDPNSAESIATTLNMLLHSPTERKIRGVQGIKHAAKFSWERTAAETLDIYRDVIRTRV